MAQGYAAGLNVFGPVISAGTQSQATGTVSFANSNGVTFGLSNGTLTASAAGGGGGAGSVNISAGTTSQNLTNFVFSNSNGLSFGLNGSTITGTVKTDYLTTQTNPAFSAQGGSSTFQTLSFSNANGISFSNSAGQVQASYTVPTLTNSSMTVSDAASSATVARLAFTNLNGVTLSLSTGAGGSHTIVGSHNALTSQSNQAFSAQGGSSAFQTLVFTNSNGVSFSNTNGSIWASHNGLTTQTNQQMTLFATSNTTQSSTGTTNASSLIFAGAGAVSVGISNGSVVISGATAAGGGISNVNLSAGTTSQNLSAFVFSNANNVSFGLNGSTVTATATVATSLSNIRISAGTTSNLLSAVTFSNSNGVSFGLNGSTLTGSVAGPVSLTQWDPLGRRVYDRDTLGNNTVAFLPQNAPTLQYDRVGFLLQLSNTSNLSGSASLTISFGIYTRNASTLSLRSSVSFSTAVTMSGTAGSFSLYSNPRLLTVGLTDTLTEGEYVFAFASALSTAGANVNWSNFLGSQSNIAFRGIFGQPSNAYDAPQLGMGLLSVSTNALPSSVAYTDIQASGQNAWRFQALFLASSTL